MTDALNIKAQIEDVQYNPQLCKELNLYPVEKFYSGEAFSDSSFVINHAGEKYAISTWVSPKRTRSYPRARVYDTYKHKNRVTIIPLVKDEGADGDRDYLQWDTISLMSLLQVNVIIAYYNNAEKNPSYENKITNQEYDYSYISTKFNHLVNFQSDALHWNIKQASDLTKVAEKTEEAYYNKISPQTGVQLHGKKYFDKHLQEIVKEAEEFKKSSRSRAKLAQRRESLTDQPKERTVHEKAIITIENYIGGKYFLTVDEAVIKGNTLFLIEKKHTRRTLPSLGDIKNGLALMILFTNLTNAKVAGKKYQIKPVLGLTGENFSGVYTNFDNSSDPIDSQMNNRYKKRLGKIFHEGNVNGFGVYAIQSGNEEKEKALLDRLAGN